MRVDLALFEGDNLLDRLEISIGPTLQCNHFKHFHALHELVGDAAKIRLDGFPESFGINHSDIDMPVHESEDWETLDLGRFMIAFWCRVGV